jgi:nucleotide-binding universal stress UspA family protein
MAFQRVLIAVDASPLAAHAAEVGAELAGAIGAQIGFITVVDAAVGASIATDVPATELLEDSRLEAARLLKALRMKLAAEPTALEFKAEGVPGDEILKAARAWPADIVVIGSHGRSGVGRLLLGSVAEGVVRHSPCPVLVVRSQP